MLLIDTHYHVSPWWFEPIEVFLFHMERVGVDQAALVQIKGQSDNSYLMECERRYPGRFAVVGFVDSRRPDAPDALARLVEQGAKGVRLWGDERSPGADPLAIWRRAEELGTVVSCAGSAAMFASSEFAQLVEALPRLPMVIEHLGGIHSEPEAVKARPDAPDSAYRKIVALSRFPNAYMKIAPFGEFMPRPMPFREPPFDLAEAPPFIDMAIEAFGADRLMVGADPTSSMREGYANGWRLLQEYLRRWSMDEQEAVLGKTAQRLFGLPEEVPAFPTT